MNKVKRKFKSVQEMRNFLKELNNHSLRAIKHHNSEIKKYEEILKKADTVVMEPVKKYRGKIK